METNEERNDANIGRSSFDLPPSATRTKALSANKNKTTTNAKTNTNVSSSATQGMASTTNHTSDPGDPVKSTKKRKLSATTSINAKTISSIEGMYKGDEKPKKSKPSPKNKESKSNLDLKSKSHQKRPGEFADDTPKQFARLLAWSQDGKKIRRGLDDGINGAKTDKKQKQKQKQKQKAGKEKQERENNGRKPKTEGDEASLAIAGGGSAEADTNAINGDENSDNDADSEDASRDRNTNTEAKDTTSTSTRKTNRKINSNSNSTSTAAVAFTPDAGTPSSPLKIRPGERLRDFSLRVDQSLPLTSIPKYTTKIKSDATIAGLNGKAARANMTKHNRRLVKLQERWREEEKKRRERLEGKMEEGEEKREVEEGLWVGVGGRGGRGGKGSKKEKEKGREGVDDDPWRELEGKRREEAQMKTNALVQGKEKEKEKDKNGMAIGGVGGGTGLSGYTGVPGLTPGSSVQEPPRLMLDTRKLKRMFKVDDVR